MAEEKFLIENYGKKGTFASFLPGISGEKGIPIWCYYVTVSYTHLDVYKRQVW